jgi:hypothetical protein
MCLATRKACRQLSGGRRALDLELKLAETFLTLDELGLKHGTDKASGGHNYLVLYEELLTSYRAKPELLLLEVGVRDGASVRLWQDYFPQAQIVGVDILESCRAHQDSRIAIEIGDQSDPNFLEALSNKYKADIIFDDGSHSWSHQIDTFRMLFPHLNAGGLFVCEDLHTSRSKWVGKYGRPYTYSASKYFGLLAPSCPRKAKFTEKCTTLS